MPIELGNSILKIGIDQKIGSGMNINITIIFNALLPTYRITL